MGYTLFISDLHLCETRPHIQSDFLNWLEKSASQADALYILGDFFEYWAGDDVLDTSSTEAASTHLPLIKALKTLQQSGVDVYVMHGNRDFLIGNDFCSASGAVLIQDPSLVTIYGQPVLLSHGDDLCTDDVNYMAFKAEVRTQEWQQNFLSQPLQARLDFIANARASSDADKAAKSMAIMDVNTQAVEKLLSEYAYPPLLIHGHTHRPNRHVHEVNGHQCERWVLGDWYDQGSCLKLDQSGAVTSLPLQG